MTRVADWLRRVLPWKCLLRSAPKRCYFKVLFRWVRRRDWNTWRCFRTWCRGASRQCVWFRVEAHTWRVPCLRLQWWLALRDGYLFVFDFWGGTLCRVLRTCLRDGASGGRWGGCRWGWIGGILHLWSSCLSLLSKFIVHYSLIITSNQIYTQYIRLLPTTTG